ncbi:dipeptide/oligopeptide/nickel ABC transporter permease/ATP-binding protein [Agromyces neolithicus]|uniref:Dipeptide/oligopeptide/nickel ABC transporter permease/ATP-binding protein n=1 Tax=Agromyces neolithicus TaxID=269420 RepID=A0ABN2M9D0_9MICO
MKTRRILRTPLGIAATTLMALVLLTAIFAPILWGDAAEVVDTDDLLAGPSPEHPIGTDNLGRDLLLRVLVATRLSVFLAIAATVIAVVAGLILGVLPLLLGRAGKPATWLVGIAVAFPGLLLALFFAVIFGSGWQGAVLAVGFAGAPSFARLCQTLVSAVAARDFVAAARVGGVGRLRVLTRHILPNIGEPLIVNATIGAGGALLAFAGLSFLGLGVQPPEYDWGRLMMDGLAGIYINPLAALAPGIAVVIAGLAFNLVGEAAARSLGIEVGAGPVRRLVRRMPQPSASPAIDASEPEHADTVLDVQNLRVSFPGPDGEITPVRGVNLRIRRGEAVGIVGESGSGKSLTALSIAQLVEHPGEVEADGLRFLGEDLLHGDEASHRKLLGTSLAMVFQDPMTSFNPTKRMGSQLAEVASQHGDSSKRDALARAVERLGAVRITDPERRARQYPHEFSGGMRQRAMIGMGLMAAPQLIIADEPTTALDVTVQQQVLNLLESIRRRDDVALLLISHDVSVVAEVCDRVLVMYAGRIVEELPADRLQEAAHPYTRALLAAVPDMQTDLNRPLATVPGRPIDPAQLPHGCAYAARCPLADAHCRTADPELTPVRDDFRAACWHAGEPLPNLAADAAADPFETAEQVEADQVGAEQAGAEQFGAAESIDVVVEVQS